MSTEPPNPDLGGRSRAAGGAPTTRGVVLEVRDSSIVVTVMPSDAPPYRARVPVPADGHRSDVRTGSHVELVVGADPGDVRLAGQAPPTT